MTACTPLASHHWPLLVLLAAVLAGVSPQRARAEEWSWLRSENANSREGNEKLASGDAEGALAAYDRAARELPSQAGVHHNRGLSLLALGRNEEAASAFELAAKPGGDATVRANAYYDLGLTLYKQGDVKAGEDDHKTAQGLFRDAVEALKKSLTLRPGDRNTAWNYELALRRLREEEEKQKQQEQEQQDQEQQQDQQDQQDQQQQDQDQQDQQQQDQQQQDQQKQDQQKQDQDQQDQQQQDQQKQDQQKQDQQQQPQPEEQPEALPGEAQRALDALQESEQNLERLRALQRAQRERRKPEKDW